MALARLLSTLVWIASLVVCGYLLLLAIPLVAPKGHESAIQAIADAAKEGVLAFFAFLGAVIGVWKTLEARQTGPGGSPPTVVPPGRKVYESIQSEQLRRQLKHWVEVAQEQNARAVKLRKFATSTYSYLCVVSTALSFSVCHLAAAGFQGLLQKAYPATDFIGWRSFAIAFAQTETLFVCACVVPVWHYSRFLRKTEWSSAALRIENAYRIGGFSLFFAGVLGMVQLSPEQISTMLSDSMMLDLPVLRINYFVFLAGSRVVLFPLAGLIACAIYRHRYRHLT